MAPAGAGGDCIRSGAVGLLVRGAARCHHAAERAALHRDPGRRGHAARLFGLSKLDSPLDRHLGDEHRRYGHRSGVLAGGGLRCSAQYGAAPPCVRCCPGAAQCPAVGAGADHGHHLRCSRRVRRLAGRACLGLHSVGMVSKFFAEAIEHVDEAPVEPLGRRGLRRCKCCCTRFCHR